MKLASFPDYWWVQDFLTWDSAILAVYQREHCGPVPCSFASQLSVCTAVPQQLCVSDTLPPTLWLSHFISCGLGPSSLGTSPSNGVDSYSKF